MVPTLLEAIEADDNADLGRKLEHFLLQEDGTLLGSNPLLITCELRKVNCAQELIRLHPDFAWGKNQDGSSPMHISCENGLLTVVEALAEFDPGLCHVRDKHGRIPLHVAAMKGKEEILRALVTACPMSLSKVTSDLGESAPHLALKNNQCDSFEVLMEELKKHQQEEVLNWADNDGNTVLHIATSRKQVQILKLLLESTNGPVVPVNSRNRNGFTALDLHYRNYRDRVDKEISHLLHKAEATEGRFLPSFGGQLSHWQPPIPDLSKFTTMMSSMTKSVLLAVFIFIAGAAFACLFNLTNIYPPKDHAGFTEISAKGLISAPHLLPDVFHFLVFNTVTFTGSVIVILVNTWSLVREWSLCFRAVPVFVIGTMTISYALVLKKMVPKFWVTIGKYKISSFSAVWLYNLPMIFCIFMIWLIVKQILQTFFTLRKRPRIHRTSANHPPTISLTRIQANSRWS